MAKTILLHFGTAAILVSAVETVSQPLNCPRIIQPFDAADGNFFGDAMEVVGGKLFFGAPGRQNGGNSGEGAVYVYDTESLTLLRTITASDANPSPEPVRFGRSIAVEGDHLLVGSSDPDPNSPVNSGAAYLMQISTGTQLDRYTDVLATPGRSSPEFARSVALTPNFAIVGDPSAINDVFTVRAGVVNFFSILSGEQEIRLSQSTSTYSGDFGQTIKTVGDKVYIAGRFASGLNAYDAATRLITDRIRAPVDPLYFGFGLAIHGNLLAAADSAYFVDQGEFFDTAVYLFDLDSNAFIRTFTVDPDPGDIGLGRYVALNDQYLLASRFNAPGFGISVLVFDTQTGDLLGEIQPPAGSELGFGSSMILDGDLAYINSRPSSDFPSPGNAVLVYDLSQIVLCPADVNGDGLLTPADFNAWVIAFNAKVPECDQNNNGTCEPADFNAWIVNFNAGC